MKPRSYVLHEANYHQLLEYRPNVAVLPWGATEAHNHHMPHGTDVVEATEIAIAAAERAVSQGARPIVLPTIPFGNNAQQLDQVATIHCSTATATAILHDVCTSLKAQGIDRLVIVNAHGGNEFKPLIRDAQQAHDMLIVRVNFFELVADVTRQTVEHPGDHADEMETSVLLHLQPDWVVMEQAGEGGRVPFAIEGLDQAGVWTPRPWSASCPDTGCGDPRQATAEKGRVIFDAAAQRCAEVLVGLSQAQRGQLPYV
ncbi:creatininase family protein [Planctomycetales bacterium ZRK34]|nr:creatininase family protein [Planctomycetales bacterium ZRK34]